MYEWFSHRANRDLACDGECVECGQVLSSRLLWPVRARQGSETITALLCFACVAVEMLRIFSGEAAETSNAADRSAAGTGSAAAEAPAAKRCDRCQRRARPTAEHHGFNLCAECRGGLH
jgi:hypothetical protein